MVYCFGDYELDEDRRELRREGQNVAIEPKVFAVLLYLIEHRDRVISKAEILAQCWAETAVSEWALTQCLTKIRRAIQPARTDSQMLKTVHRQGYRFVGEVITPTKEPPRQLEALPTASPPLSPSTSSDAPLTDHDLSRLELQPLVSAERRQLTVLHGALDDAFLRVSQRDPEALLEIIRAFQAACKVVIERFGGHVAQSLPEGLIVYFGYPQAHDDDAHRAVQAGLQIVDALGANPSPVLQAHGERSAVRIGIHTGLVVVSELGEHGGQSAFAVGETPGVAARLQTLADANSVVISAATAQLVAGYFTWETLGEHLPPGETTGLALYRVLGDGPAQTRLDVEAPRGLTPFVGRQTELMVLRERWSQAQDGIGQVVVLSGEAGIGKSRLTQVLKTHLVDNPHLLLECRSSPYYQHTAFYPMIDLLERLCQFQRGDALAVKLTKLEQTLSEFRLPARESVYLCGALLSLPLPEDRYPPIPWTPQQQRQKALETLLAILMGLAIRRPTVFILEDAHWMDASTLEMLDLLIDQIPTARFLVLLVCRPEFQPSWSSRSYLTHMTLARLPHQQAESMVTQVSSGKPLPVEVAQQIVAKADGVPLFIEELTKALLESGRLEEVNGRYELVGSIASLAIPVTLRDSLMARLDRLGAAKGIAQIGATIGRQFSYEILQAALQIDEEILQAELNRLIDAELLYQHGLAPHSTYTFKHALIQDTAYQSLLKSTRQQYHQRIGQVLEVEFPETVKNEPELLAYHYTEAGLSALALAYWQRAGDRANRRSAYQEAIHHLENGLTVLETLPETPERVAQEIDLQTALGQALMATQGWGAPAVAHVYARARVLSQQVEASPELFPVVWGLWRFYFVQAQYQTARKLAEQCLSLAQRADDSALLLLAHHALGSVAYWLGEASAGRRHLEQALAFYQPQAHRSLAAHYGLDLGVWCLSYVAWPLWILGYPDQARSRSDEALALAHEVAHPLSLASALYYAALLYHMRREGPAAQACAEAAITLSKERGFLLYETLGANVRGWSLAVQGQAAEGITQMRQSRDTLEAMGAVLYWPCYLAWLAEAYHKEPEAGVTALAEALTIVESTDERWWEAELYRIKGELLLMTDNGLRMAELTPEACFQHALEVARQQQAKSLELRAATSLARLWQSQGKHREAYDLLAPVYGWFTEGFDTADLKDAKALLEELAG